MKHDPWLYMDLAPDVAQALRVRARASGHSIQTEARLILEQVLLAPCPTAAKTPDPADEQPLLAPVRALLAADLASATGWTDLQDRLAAHGYTFRERGGGLALYCLKTAARICKASELGWTYADLMRRFKAPFPGHSHTHIARRVLGADMPRNEKQSGLFEGLTDEDDDIILIEPI